MLLGLIQGEHASAVSQSGFAFLGYVLYRAAWGRLRPTTRTA
jgi:hypothetical protein